MLAEIFILRLETTMRSGSEPRTVSSSQHVPFNPIMFAGFKVRTPRVRA